MSIGFFVASVVLLGAGIAFWRWRAAPAPPPPTGAEAPRKFLFQIEIPAGATGCNAARALREQRFAKNEAPTLPLLDCPSRAECRCRYRTLPERRIVVRRVGPDRRQSLRFEPDNPPRRKGPGRRKQDRVSWLWRG